MELRKVQLTGGSSLTVTLPKGWTEKANLEAGDVVGCTEQADGSLAVLPHAKGTREIQQYTIQAGGASDDHLFRRIIAAYLSGYDSILVHADRELPPENRRAVRRAVTRVMGLEIVEEDPNSITVQDFLDPREFHMDKALRRMNMLTKAMQGEAGDLMIDAEAIDLDLVQDRDDEVDRLYWLVNKQFHALLRDVSQASKMKLTPGRALNFLLVARLCERTADHAARVAGESVRLPRTPEREVFLKELSQAWNEASGLFGDAVGTFLVLQPGEADEVIGAAEAVQELRADLLKRATDFGSEAVGHLAFIIESIGRTAAYAADVAEVAINHEVAGPP